MDKDEMEMAYSFKEGREKWLSVKKRFIKNGQYCTVLDDDGEEIKVISERSIPEKTIFNTDWEIPSVIFRPKNEK